MAILFCLFVVAVPLLCIEQGVRWVLWRITPFERMNK